MTLDGPAVGPNDPIRQAARQFLTTSLPTELGQAIRTSPIEEPITEACRRLNPTFPPPRSHDTSNPESWTYESAIDEIKSRLDSLKEEAKWIEDNPIDLPDKSSDPAEIPQSIDQSHIAANNFGALANSLKRLGGERPISLGRYRRDCINLSHAGATAYQAMWECRRFEPTDQPLRQAIHVMLGGLLDLEHASNRQSNRLR